MHLKEQLSRNLKDVAIQEAFYEGAVEGIKCVVEEFMSIQQLHLKNMPMD